MVSVFEQKIINNNYCYYSFAFTAWDCGGVGYWASLLACFKNPEKCVMSLEQTTIQYVGGSFEAHNKNDFAVSKRKSLSKSLSIAYMRS